MKTVFCDTILTNRSKEYVFSVGYFNVSVGFFCLTKAQPRNFEAAFIKELRLFKKKYPLYKIIIAL